MHGVLSKPVCLRKMILSAGLKLGGHRVTQLDLTLNDIKLSLKQRQNSEVIEL